MASVFAVPRLLGSLTRPCSRRLLCQLRQPGQRSLSLAAPRPSPLQLPSAIHHLRLRPGKQSRRTAHATLARKAPATGARRSAEEHGPAPSSFPETSSKSVAYWLLGSAASVFGIVVFGGLTRLTESGLSITEWRPVTGSLPPTSASDWGDEFAKYRSSPEFAQLNPHMTLDEFKRIYWMEWGHRLWGRLIGVAFVVPTMYFVARRRVSAPMAWKITGINGLIALQGVIGWWMVKSGLKDDLFAQGSHPRVSQYRLAAHLGAAFTVYGSMLLCGLSILREHALLRLGDPAAGYLQRLQHANLRILRGSATGLVALVFTTALSGALVAGLDAGLIYNEFPYMGAGLTPPRSELLDPRYSRSEDRSDLWWRNMLENPSLVQLDHRILATTTFTAVLALFAYARFSSRVRQVIPRDTQAAVTGMVHLVLAQATLGISTLIYMVPTWLASAHQAGSLALLSGALLLFSRLAAPRTAALRRLALQAHSPRPPKLPAHSSRNAESSQSR